MAQAATATASSPFQFTSAPTMALPSGAVGRSGAIDVGSTPFQETTNSYEQSRRQISSVVVSEEVLGQLPAQGAVRYVEVPVVEEVVRHVPKRQVVEVEKVVPKYEYETVERIVEIPQIQYVDRQVDKPQIQEVIKCVPVKHVQEIPKEIVRTVPKIEYVQVQKVVEIPGEIVEIPKPYCVERKVDVKRPVDKQLPVVVAQTIRPVVTESPAVIDIDIFEYEPNVIPVDVHVARPVPSQLIAVGATEELHQPVVVPAAQYNTILRSVNPHLAQEDLDQLPYIKEGTSIPFLGVHETPGTSAPNASAVFLHGANPATLSTARGGVASSGPASQALQVESAGTAGHKGERRSERLTSHNTLSTNYVPPVYPTMSVATKDAMVAEEQESMARTKPFKGHEHHGKQHRAAKPSGAGRHGGLKKRSGCHC